MLCISIILSYIPLCEYVYNNIGMYCLFVCTVCVTEWHTCCHFNNYVSFAALQVSFDPQNYTITEGDAVNITLETSTSNYEFEFTVTLEHMDGTATGESCS